MTDIRGATKKKISKRIAVPLIVAACIIVLLLLLLPFNLIVHSSQTIKVLVPVSYFVVALVRDPNVVIQKKTKFQFFFRQFRSAGLFWA